MDLKKVHGVGFDSCPCKNIIGITLVFDLLFVEELQAQPTDLVDKQTRTKKASHRLFRQPVIHEKNVIFHHTFTFPGLQIFILWSYTQNENRILFEFLQYIWWTFFLIPKYV